MILPNMKVIGSTTSEELRTQSETGQTANEWANEQSDIYAPILSHAGHIHGWNSSRYKLPILLRDGQLEPYTKMYTPGRVRIDKTLNKCIFVQLISLLYYKTEWSLSKLYNTNHYSAELMIATNSMVFASLRTNDKIKPMSINILDLHCIQCIQISFRNWDTSIYLFSSASCLLYLESLLCA